MSKKLSIIVPVYNVEKYIVKCIESLLSQDYKDYEIILIDDGSTDNSKNICMNYEKEYSDLIKVYSKKNGGQASARNLALKKIKSEYVLFVDSDDYIKQNCLKDLMDKIEGNDILVFNHTEVSENVETKICTFDKSISDFQKRYIVSMPGPCNKIIRTSLLKDNNLFFPENIIYEDLAIIPALGLYANKFVFDDNAYYYYVQRSGSTMHQKQYNPKFENIFAALDNLCLHFKNDYSEELEYIYIWHLLRNASLRFLDFEKYDNLDKIVKIIKNKFPKWSKNKYFKKYDFKRKMMAYLFMKRHYKIIQMIRRR